MPTNGFHHITEFGNDVIALRRRVGRAADAPYTTLGTAFIVQFIGTQASERQVRAVRNVIKSILVMIPTTVPLSMATATLLSSRILWTTDRGSSRET